MDKSVQYRYHGFMARPKTFDRDKALTTAKMVFWKAGYSATTTDDLRLAMGIGRQSFYDTFKSKHDVFIEILNQYNADRETKLFSIIGKNHSPVETLQAILTDIASEDPDIRALGCMGVTSVCQFGTSDKQVSNETQRAGAVWKKTFENLLTQAKRAGEIRKSIDENTTALYLQAILAGMRVSARGGMKPKELRDIAAVAIEGLR